MDDAILPGEPISEASLTAAKAPFTPTSLSWVIVVSLSAFALSNVLNGLSGEMPKITVAFRKPVLSKRFTWSPPVPRTPEPV